MLNYYLACFPCLIYWLTCGFIDLFVTEEIKTKHIENNISKKEVFYNVLNVTGSTIIANMIIVYFNILNSDEFRILYILLGIWWIDTIEYFTHRYMHQNKYMYKNFHKVHHYIIISLKQLSPVQCYFVVYII
jgi:sterol desaturase/sphingolipid hydroxylase (fatty acid hydroxylase superfamily)